MISWNFERVLNADLKYALLVLQMTQPMPTKFRPTIERLWNHASERVLVDGGANWLYEHCPAMQPPHIVCGDFDSIRSSVKQFYAEQGALIQELSDQDETDFTKSVEFTFQHHANCNPKDSLDCLIVLWSTGGRIDQCLSCIHTLQKNVEQIPIYLLDPFKSLSWMLKPNSKHEIRASQRSKWCSLMPVGQPCKVTTTGFRWNLTERVIRFGGFVSSSNQFDSNSSVCSVNTDNPLLFSMDVSFLIGEPNKSTSE